MAHGLREIIVVFIMLYITVEMRSASDCTEVAMQEFTKNDLVIANVTEDEIKYEQVVAIFTGQEGDYATVTFLKIEPKKTDKEQSTCYYYERRWMQNRWFRAFSVKNSKPKNNLFANKSSEY